jgi:integrase
MSDVNADGPQSRTVNLTDAFCKNAPIGEWRDAGNSGLVLRVIALAAREADGGKERVTRLWSVRYKVANERKHRRVSLGPYAHKSLAAARLEALEMMRRVTHGENPAIQKQERAVAISVEQLVEEFLLHNTRLAASTLADYRHIFYKDVVPQIGERAVVEITADHVRDIIKLVKARGALKRADQTRIAIAGLFKWARGARQTTPGLQKIKGLPIDSPTRSVPREYTGKARRRPWTEDELKRIWDALEFGTPAKATRKDGTPRKPVQVDDATRDIVQLCLLLGCRRGEIATARISEFDIPNKRWTIAGTANVKGKVKRGRTKTEAEHIFPLPPAALAIVQGAINRAVSKVGAIDIASRGLRGAFLFPSGAGTELPHVDPHSVSRAMRRLCDTLEVEDLHLHDARSTCRTWLRELGTPNEVLDTILGHAPRSIGETVYTAPTINYIEKHVRPALEAWAEYVAKVVTDRALPCPAGQPSAATETEPATAASLPTAAETSGTQA